MTRRLFPFLLCLFVLIGAAPASAQQAEVQTTWRLLDYVSVDYAGAVSGGRIVNTADAPRSQPLRAARSPTTASLAGSGVTAACVALRSE